MALGATRQSIVRMVMLEGSAIVAIGLAAGMVLALSAGRLIESFLHEVTPMDASTYLFSATALLMVGRFAALLPVAGRWYRANEDFARNVKSSVMPLFK